MTRHAAIRVHDNFTPGQATVTLWATDNEAARWINKVFGICITPFSRQYRLDDFFHHRFLQVFEIHGISVLGREDNGIDPGWLAIFIAECDLTFRIRF